MFHHFNNFIDGMSDPFDFPELERQFNRHNVLAKPTSTQNPLLIAAIPAAISAVGGIVGGLAAASGGASGSMGKIRPSTVSGNAVGAQDFIYDLEAVKAMQDLTSILNEWSGQDREFFENVYQPFQEKLMESNQALLPDIVKNSGAALKANLNDLFDSNMLKDSFREGAMEAGEKVGEFSQRFAEQVDKIPTAEQRIGQAISGVEQRFGQAGAELKKQMGARGLDVSEAGVREMMIGKATAKAGAAAAAGEAARREMMDATATATGVFSSIQEQQAGMLGAERTFTQTSAEIAPQVGGVADVGTVSEAGGLQAQLTAAEAGKQVGTESEKLDTTITQRGVQVSKFFDPETGEVVTASGESVTDFMTEQAAKQKLLEEDMASKTSVAMTEARSEAKSEVYDPLEIMGH